MNLTISTDLTRQGIKQENQNMFIRKHVKTMAVSLTLCLAFGTILNAQDNRTNVLFIPIDDLRPKLNEDWKI